MTRLPRITGRELARALESAGFIVDRTRGSHHFLKHPDGRATAIPVHSGETLALACCEPSCATWSYLSTNWRTCFKWRVPRQFSVISSQLSVLCAAIKLGCPRSGFSGQGNWTVGVRAIPGPQKRGIPFGGSGQAFDFAQYRLWGTLIVVGIAPGDRGHPPQRFLVIL
jgi:predicted RNA binding protein YcfA (HicA-like mRNA interferase family)